MASNKRWKNFLCFRYNARQDQTPAETVSTWQPWVALQMLSMPKPTNTNESAIGNIFLDTELHQKAIEFGKETGYLESIELQFYALSRSLTLEDLEDTLVPKTNASAAGLSIDQLADVYRTGDVQLIEDSFLANQSRHMKSNLFDMRNRAWVDKMIDYHDKKSTFFAVGAGHLFGDTGVLGELEKQGYVVERVVVQNPLL